MRQLYLFTTLMITLLGTTAALAQTVLVEQKFEIGSLPAGWARQQSTPSRGWVFGTSTQYNSNNVTIPVHTKFAVSNDDKYDNNATTANLADRDMLITPSFSLAGLSVAQLNFETYFPGDFGSVATVEISTDGGTNWTVLSTLTGNTAAWQSLSLNLNAYLGQANVKIAFVHNDGGEWADAFAIDDVIIYAPSANDVQLVSFDLPATVQKGVYPIDITVRNFGTATLNSFTFTWSKDGGFVSFIDEVNGLGIPAGGTATIRHNTNLILDTDGLDTIKVTLSQPNGQTDNTTSNNTLSDTLLTVLGTVEHNILFEQHTGSWCGWCPDGSLVLQEILDANANVVPMTIHDDDGMAFTDGNIINGAAVSGFPSGSIDRYKFSGQTTVGVSRTLWESLLAQRQSFESFASISASNTYNATTRELSVDVEAQFIRSIVGDYRINVFIVEDSVTGTGSGYNQRNFFRNNPDYVGHPFYSKPDPIAGYQHRYVARQFLGGPWGQASVLPLSIAPLTPYNHTFTYTLPAGWDANSVSLIAVVQKYGSATNNREIINVVSLPLNGANETALTLAPDIATVEATLIIHSACGGGMEGEVGINAVGCNDCDFEWSNGQTGSYLFGVAPGEYTVTMSNTSGVSVTKTYTIYGPINLNPSIAYNNNKGNVTLDVKGGAAPYTINWSNGGTGTTQSNLAPGTYEISVTDNNGCSTTQELKVEGTVGIVNIATIDFNLYPNPTAGNVAVELDLTNTTDVTIQVFNTVGALISERTVTGINQVRETLDLSTEANGVYIVKVIADGTNGVKRLVLNR